MKGGSAGGGSQDRAPASGLSVLKGQVELTKGCEVSCPLKCETDPSLPDPSFRLLLEEGEGGWMGSSLWLLLLCGQAPPSVPKPQWAIATSDCH